MSITVIPGGLYKPDPQLIEDDVPCPDKPVEEWTEEEKEAYDRYMWENADPGSIESVIKAITVSQEDITATISILEKIKACAAETAAETGFRNEWDYSVPEDLLKLLQFKSESISD